ncbi:MAG: 50S ribosomal protein L22 [Candidatus Dadabacteria bacterium]|nr:50S ribosomal protein L22 [Candidatus Dadabacteria bacterium]NIS10285.1 50S ribosomal protein L22 [Candidatus Dadabacteria bacterium]NIY23211.1 50S ribosomal protein L22 [Candidatus Dadabacteria bacterium]
MVSSATLKFARLSQKKTMIILDQIRGKGVEESFAKLSLINRNAAKIVSKLLKSAVANASEKGHSDTDSLYIKEAFVNKGPFIKRIRPRAMGRAFSIKKKMSHIKIVLEERGL